MKSLLKSIALLSIFGVFLSSCYSSRKIEYLQDPIEMSKSYKLEKAPENRIKSNDELFIKVSSLDDVSYNYFQAENEGTMASFNNELALSLISYSVNDSGYIYFPVIGKIHAEGLTLNELRIKFVEILADYFNQPTVVIKFAYKKITVLGEVNRPGNFAYAKERLNIFEALSMAGDLTSFGNIKSLYLIRADNESITKTEIDLRDDNLVFSEHFYLNPDDILYVKPLPSRSYRIIQTPVSLVLYGITTTFLVYNAIVNANN